MKEKTRMSAVDRKEAIINAAKPLFAKKGFNGVSVRDIAKASNVSEALLYRHFPSKEVMYRDILDYSVRIASLTLKGVENQVAGSQTLIHLVHAVFYFILFEIPSTRDEQKMHERLVFYSLLEDISFAKMVFKKMFDSTFDLITDCHKEGIRNGEILKTGSSIINSFWFTHHLAMGLNICFLTEEPAFIYEGSKEEMVEEAIQFTLRGLGVTDKAVKNYLKSDKKKELDKRFKGV